MYLNTCIYFKYALFLGINSNKFPATFCLKSKQIGEIYELLTWYFSLYNFTAAA